MGFEQETEDSQEQLTDLRGRTGLSTEAQKPGEGVPEDVRRDVGVKCASVGACGTDDEDCAKK
jgi:hypothetical protein